MREGRGGSSYLASSHEKQQETNTKFINEYSNFNISNFSLYYIFTTKIQQQQQTGIELHPNRVIKRYQGDQSL